LRSGDTHWDSGDGALPTALRELATVARLASPREPVDPMEVALRDFALAEAPPASLAADAPVHEYALTPRILAMTRVYGTTEPGRHLLATKGAPEAVIALCRLPDGQAQALRAQVEQLAAQGLRMLAVATGEWDGEAGHWPAAQDGLALRFVGLVGLADPPRPDVPAAVRACREAGVRVLMLTGDHPATAVAIARALGLPHASVLTGAQVDGLDDAALAARLAATDLCARLQPAHKLRLVRCLQADGERVAMTGDGVNDAPALVAADVGIAMGLRGTDVAREASDLVLLDDGFASIVEAIRHGRRVRANLRAAMRFIFAVHVPVVALALGPALLRGPLLLLPAHIVLLELLIDPFCSLLFEAQPGPADLMRRPPAQWSRSPFAVPNLARGLVQGAGVAAALLTGAWLLQAQGWTTEAVRTAVLLGLVAAVALLARAQLDGPPPAGRARGWTLAPVLAWGVLVLAIAGWPAMRGLMGLAPLGAEIAGATALLVVTAALWIAAARRLARSA
jgi:Ca2+-transporting ATPase